jgi:hypothetical protein
MKKILASIALLFALTTAAMAQGCGPTNPNCIVPTVTPATTSDNRAASTAFVQAALATLPALALPNGQIFIGSVANVPTPQTMGGDCTITNSGTITCTKTNSVLFGVFATLVISPVRAGDIIYWSGINWVSLAGNNSGTQCLQESNLGVPSWGACGSGSGTVTSVALAGGLTGPNNPITATGTIYTPGGFINKIYNGSISVWQRGTTSPASSTTIATYMTDGVIAYPKGAVVTCAQDGPIPQGGFSFAIKCAGLASNTDLIFGHRIESLDATPMAGNPSTFSFWYKQDSGSPQTPKISTCIPTVADTYQLGTAGKLDCANNTNVATDLASTNAGWSSCASGAWCQYAWSYTVGAGAVRGLEVNYDCNVALTSAAVHCEITGLDGRPSPGVAAGAATAPPPEIRSMQSELAWCERYYFKTYSYSVAPGSSVGVAGNAITMYAGSSGGLTGQTIPFHQVMRALPTISYWDNAGNISKVSFFNGSWNNSGATAAGPNPYTYGTSLAAQIASTTEYNFDIVAIAEF